MKLLFDERKQSDYMENAPIRKGITKVGITLWHEFWNLIKLNLLFLLSCIPIVTIPAGITAMSKICCAMVENRHFYMWSDYWGTFRRDFWSALAGGILTIGLTVLFGISIWFYAMLYATSRLFVLLAGCAVALLLITLMTACYYFPMLATVELTFGQLIKNSFAMVLRCWKRTLLALFSFLLIIGGAILLFPYSTFMSVILLFSLTSVLICLSVYPAIEEFVMLSVEKNDNPEIN